MVAEHDHEEHAAGKSVGIEKLQNVAVVHAVRVDGNAHEQVGEGHAEQKRGQEAAEGHAHVPAEDPGAGIALAAEFKGHGAEDEAEQQDEQGSVEGAEHHGVGVGEGGEGHAACGDEPNFVAVPVGALSVVDDAAFMIVGGHEGHEGAHAEVEAVENEVHGPQKRPEEEPDRFHVTPPQRL